MMQYLIEWLRKLLGRTLTKFFWELQSNKELLNGLTKLIRWNSKSNEKKPFF